MTDFFKYPSTNNFRNAVNVLCRNNLSLKNVSLDFTRTVKIHGTNAAIVYNAERDELTAQSRNRIITIENDNMGFANYVKNNESYIKPLLKDFVDKNYENIENINIVLYGEWFGCGIQNKAAVTQLKEKYFAVFAIRIITDEYDEFRRITDSNSDNLLTNHPDINMYNIHYFGSELITINFNDPLLVQEQLDSMVNKVEQLCPVAKKLEGIEGVGEGYVFACNNEEYTFKYKGEKHKSSKTKVVSEEDLKVKQQLSELVDDVVTESRLDQGIDYLREMQLPIANSSIGEYIKWVINDTHKEEGDIIKQNSDIPIKKFNSIIAIKAKEYLMKEINKF